MHFRSGLFLGTAKSGNSIILFLCVNLGILLHKMAASLSDKFSPSGGTNGPLGVSGSQEEVFLAFLPIPIHCRASVYPAWAPG